MNTGLSDELEYTNALNHLNELKKELKDDYDDNNCKRKPCKLFCLNEGKTAVKISDKVKAMTPIIKELSQNTISSTLSTTFIQTTFPEESSLAQKITPLKNSKRFINKKRFSLLPNEFENSNSFICSKKINRKKESCDDNKFGKIIKVRPRFNYCLKERLEEKHLKQNYPLIDPHSRLIDKRKHIHYKCNRFEKLFNDSKRRDQLRKYLESTRNSDCKERNQWKNVPSMQNRRSSLINKNDYRINENNEEQYKKLFGLFDFDNDKIITFSDVISACKFLELYLATPLEISKLIEPLFSDITKKSLDLNTFTKRLDILYSAMTTNQKEMMRNFIMDNYESVSYVRSKLPIGWTQRYHQYSTYEKIP